jgi:hypothetical protein
VTAPIRPETPGLWKPCPASIAAEATRIRPCTSNASTMARSTSRPGAPSRSASARIAGSVGEVGWLSGHQVLSKSSAWPSVPFA